MDKSELELLERYNYKIIDTIYKGYFFQIYGVKKENVEYALKRFEDFSLIQYIEFDIMTRLNNPFIIALHEIIYNPSMINITQSANVNSGAGYYMIMEKALSDIGGTEWLPAVVSDEFLVKAIFEMFCGLKYIHECGVVHGDIKPQNILVHGGTIKYTDFGLADYIIGESKKIFSRYSKYSVPYRPPEFDNNYYLYFTSDVWALGCTIYEVIMRERRFNVSDDIDLQSIHKQYRHKKVDLSGGEIGSDEFRAELEVILNDCFNYDPKKRPMAKDILQYPLFSGYQCIVQSPPLDPYPVPSPEYTDWIKMRKRIITSELLRDSGVEDTALAISIFDRYADKNGYEVSENDMKRVINIAKRLLGIGYFIVIKMNDEYHRIAKALNYEFYTPNIYSFCLNVLSSKNIGIQKKDIIKALSDVDALRKERYVSNSCDRLEKIISLEI